MSNLKVNFKRFHPEAKIPTYGTAGAGAFDIFFVYMEISGGGRILTFHTGFGVEIPEGHAMFIYSRSGHGFKNQMRLTNAVGLIDSDYRGEVKAQMILDMGNDFRPNYDTAIAQGVIMPVPKVQFIVVDELSDTARGNNGFGSTTK
jgi:dUTP pyrophosphatase